MWRILLLNYFMNLLFIQTYSYKYMPTSTKLSNSPLKSTLTKESVDYKFHLSNKVFHFTEIIDDEIVESRIRLCSTGEIIFLKSPELNISPDFQDIKGSWSCCKKSLQMMVERTFLGSYSEYTVKSLYIKTREEFRHGLLSIGGDIFENNEIEDIDFLSQKSSVPTFALKSNANTIGQFMITTESNSLTRTKSVMIPLNQMHDSSSSANKQHHNRDSKTVRTIPSSSLL